MKKRNLVNPNRKLPKPMKIEYSSNNSGGGWWLTDEHRQKLEAAGWEIQWGGTYFCHSTFISTKPPVGKPQPCRSERTCPGHRKADSFKEAQPHRWLGAIATRATRTGLSLRMAEAEFQDITGQDPDEQGCRCCDQPHSFHEVEEVAHVR